MSPSRTPRRAVRAAELLIAGLAAAILASPARGAASPEPGATTGRPNIVLIVIDTLRADHLSFYGYSEQTAPFLSTLAGEGMLFERAYSTSSWTAPAAASLFTSLYPEDHGVLTGLAAANRIQAAVASQITVSRIPEQAVTLGEVMRKAGYTPWGFSDNPNVSRERGFAQGFHHFESNPDWYWGAEELNRRVGGPHRIIKSSAPYFLYIHYIDPHYPYHKRMRWFRVDTRGEDAARARLSPRRLRSVMRKARYDSEIGYVDEHIRRMYRLFGWDKNTLLVVTSDHGEELFDHGELGHGNTLYEEVTRIPLIVHDTGGFIGSGRVATPVSIVDILPSLAQFVGYEDVEGMQGESFLPLVSGEAPPDGAERVLFAHLERSMSDRSGSDHGATEDEREKYRTAAAIAVPWKLIVDSRGEASLYNLIEDPGERVELGELHPEQARRLATELQRFSEAKKRFEPSMFEKTMTPEQLERLRTLGYVQ